MKKIVMPLFLASFLLLSQSAYATDAQERVYLTQVLNTLQSAQPLVLAAQAAQPANTRVKFHYTRYQDAKGQWHNGLLEDLNAVKAGIAEQLNAVSVEPRNVLPLKGDYLPMGATR